MTSDVLAKADHALLNAVFLFKQFVEVTIKTVLLFMSVRTLYHTTAKGPCDIGASSATVFAAAIPVSLCSARSGTYTHFIYFAPTRLTTTF
jgi:hypothetical protein